MKDRLQTTAPTISRWEQRFLEDGLEGLDTYHPGQPAVVLTSALRTKILAATRRKPKDGSTHWSCRKLAAAIPSARTWCIGFSAKPDSSPTVWSVTWPATILILNVKPLT